MPRKHHVMIISDRYCDSVDRSEESFSDKDLICVGVSLTSGAALHKDSLWIWRILNYKWYLNNEVSRLRNVLHVDDTADICMKSTADRKLTWMNKTFCRCKIFPRSVDKNKQMWDKKPTTNFIIVSSGTGWTAPDVCFQHQVSVWDPAAAPQRSVYLHRYVTTQFPAAMIFPFIAHTVQRPTLS